MLFRSCADYVPQDLQLAWAAFVYHNFGQWELAWRDTWPELPYRLQRSAVSPSVQCVATLACLYRLGIKASSPTVTGMEKWSVKCVVAESSWWQLSLVRRDGVCERLSQSYRERKACFVAGWFLFSPSQRGPRPEYRGTGWKRWKVQGGRLTYTGM